MIRPGRMRHVITIQRREVEGVSASGGEVEAWADLASLRAELIKQERIEDRAGVAGSRGGVAVQFRTRVFGGVQIGDRVIWRGLPYDVVTITGGDFDMARGLELHCEGEA